MEEIISNNFQKFLKLQGLTFIFRDFSNPSVAICQLTAKAVVKLATFEVVRTHTTF